MNETAFLIGWGILFFLVAVPIHLSDVRHHVRYGHIPRGWRMRDRISRADHPFYFWCVTKGRLILLAVIGTVWVGMFVKVVL